MKNKENRGDIIGEGHQIKNKINSVRVYVNICVVRSE